MTNILLYHIRLHFYHSRLHIQSIHHFTHLLWLVSQTKLEEYLNGSKICRQALRLQQYRQPTSGLLSAMDPHSSIQIMPYADTLVVCLSAMEIIALHQMHVWYAGQSKCSINLRGTGGLLNSFTLPWSPTSYHDIVAPTSAVGRLLLQARLPGTRCQTISVIRRLAKTL